MMRNCGLKRKEVNEGIKYSLLLILYILFLQ